jgi:hypothetical protein
MAVALAGLVRIRHHGGSLRLQPELDASAGNGMKTEQWQLTWRFLGTLAMIVAAVGVATLLAAR